jgi:hypothetical protein
VDLFLKIRRKAIKPLMPIPSRAIEVGSGMITAWENEPLPVAEAPTVAKRPAKLDTPPVKVVAVKVTFIPPMPFANFEKS